MPSSSPAAASPATATPEGVPVAAVDCQIGFVEKLPPADFAHFRSPLLDNFAFCEQFSSAKTQLAWIRVAQGGQTVALVPSVRLVKRPATDMLRHGLRRWLGPTLGPLAKKTTLLIDTAFLAYDDSSPFYIREGGLLEPEEIKRQVVKFARQIQGIDTLWITEPESQSTWAADEGFQQFYTLPMAQIELGNSASFAEHVASLSKKRRRNLKHEREVFAEAGGEIETHQATLSSPADRTLLDELLACLDASASHSQFAVPYNDVLTNPQAFSQQVQTILVARVDSQVVGFMSFLMTENRLMQCHGGLDYQRSHEVLAYHNLIQAAVKLALKHELKTVSMGPLNNETKRRAASTLKPMVANLWNRNPLDAFAAKKFFAKNLEVYRGEVGSQQQ
ncbi:peptidogalycan biosysnthesis protein [Adhaeretor mobilis]|uniref:peptidogalycan biosysnthesis protein n=1 Tax=Adhaeretor mobilis TaxID=1930276 RepID=UPI001C54E20B|nr:peptidogalycan biosysnthesis protein [Adhaeretor mobilis]